MAMLVVGYRSDEWESAVSDVGSCASDKAVDELEVVWKPGPDSVYHGEAAHVDARPRQHSEDDGGASKDQLVADHVGEAVAETLCDVDEHYSHQNVSMGDASIVMQSEMSEIDEMLSQKI